MIAPAYREGEPGRCADAGASSPASVRPPEPVRPPKHLGRGFFAKRCSVRPSAAVITTALGRELPRYPASDGRCSASDGRGLASVRADGPLVHGRTPDADSPIVDGGLTHRSDLSDAAAMHSTLRRITRSEALDQGITDRQLSQLVRTGTLHRVRPGEFALVDEWAAVDRLAQHRELVLRTAERAEGQQVYSHLAAAALWGIRIRGAWPSVVDVLVEPAGGGRSSGRVRRRALGLDDREIVELDGLLVTSPAQTIVDLARILPFVDGVVAADSALGTSFGRASLTSKELLWARLDAASRGRGLGRARAVVAEADGRAESPPETESRLAAVLLGFPRPELQREFETPSGRRRADLWWEHYGIAGECDGRAKYLDPAYLRGREPADVFRAEKSRDRELMAHPLVRSVLHWDPADLRPLARFYDILRGAGLPSSLPRPTWATLAEAPAMLHASSRRLARHTSASRASHS